MEMQKSLSANANKIIFEVFEFFYELAEHREIIRIFDKKIKSLMFSLKELRVFITHTERSLKHISRAPRSPRPCFEDTVSLSRHNPRLRHENAGSRGTPQGAHGSV